MSAGCLEKAVSFPRQGSKIASSKAKQSDRMFPASTIVCLSVIVPEIPNHALGQGWVGVAGIRDEKQDGRPTNLLEIEDCVLEGRVP